jgi:SAM-dependent MidA family methyltransferase
MTPLGEIVAARIRAEGPVTVAEYMALCLGHPRHGYYATRDPLGASGDFTTAPEISQMFGEIIGLWLADRWAAMGRPRPVRLVELGPGRGTLMADALRAARAAGLAEAAEIWLVETSSALRSEQAKRLPGASWADALAAVPEGPTLLVANEFLDALPVHQFLETPEGWRERLVGLREGRLAWGLSDVLPRPAGAPAASAGWAERSPAVDAVAREIGARVAAGGAALLVDYGYRAADRPPGPTLQAVRAHAHADPLEAPGEADLTWLVDFDRLAACLGGCAVHVAEQGAFLARLGIGQRAEALARADPPRAGAVADALERLTAPEGMGTRFKALAATPPDQPPPPGFGDVP